MDTNTAPAPDASDVLEIVGCLMAVLIEHGVIDIEDAREVERRVNDARVRRIN